MAYSINLSAAWHSSPARPATRRGCQNPGGSGHRRVVLKRSPGGQTEELRAQIDGGR
jgi:hypothetical protein